MFNIAMRFRIPKPWGLRAESNSDRFHLKLQDTSRHSRWLKIAFSCRKLTVISGIGSLVPILVLFSLSYMEKWEYIEMPSSAFDFLFYPFAYLFGFAILNGFLAMFLLKIGQRSISSDLVNTDYFRCPKCFYDLNGRSNSEEICPECGQYTPRRECVRLWCKLLRTEF